MNFWDLLILALIAGGITLAIRTLRGKKDAGGCSCGCAGCTKDCTARQDEKEKTNE